MRFLERLRAKRAAMDTIENLTPEQHAQLESAFVNLTPESEAELVKAAQSGGSHPILDLLSSFITDPTKLAAVVQFITTIIALFPK